MAIYMEPAGCGLFKRDFFAAAATGEPTLVKAWDAAPMLEALTPGTKGQSDSSVGFTFRS